MQRIKRIWAAVSHFDTLLSIAGSSFSALVVAGGSLVTTLFDSSPVLFSIILGLIVGLVTFVLVTYVNHRLRTHFEARERLRKLLIDNLRVMEEWHQDQIDVLSLRLDALEREGKEPGQS